MLDEQSSLSINTESDGVAVGFAMVGVNVDVGAIGAGAGVCATVGFTAVGE